MQDTDALTQLALDGELAFEVEVHLGRLDPRSVRVELYAEPQGGMPAFKQEMQRSTSPAAKGPLRLVSSAATAHRPA